MQNKPKTLRRRTLPLKTALWNRRSFGQRLMLLVIGIVLVIYVQASLIAGWYINRHRNEPLNIGVTFSTEYANYLGVNPKETFKALRDDMGFKRFRLVTFWNMIEPSPGKYDFSDIDWQLKMINEVNGTASVAIGLRQPRWPECHIPAWAETERTTLKDHKLDDFITATVNHVRDNPAVQSYQLENEYFLGVFGECPPADRQQLIHEFDLVKKLDPDKPILLSLANNYFGVPTGQPRADQFAVSVYKRVFDFTVTHRYLEYPFTPKYYAYRAGLTEIFTGRSSMLHELQVEPWIPPGMDMHTAPISEMYKSMDPKRAASRIPYAIETGFRDIDLWGGEWWYYLKVVRHNPDIWDTMKSSLDNARLKYKAN